MFPRFLKNSSHFSLSKIVLFDVDKPHSFRIQKNIYILFVGSDEFFCREEQNSLTIHAQITKNYSINDGRVVI